MKAHVTRNLWYAPTICALLAVHNMTVTSGAPPPSLNPRIRRYRSLWWCAVLLLLVSCNSRDADDTAAARTPSSSLLTNSARPHNELISDPGRLHLPMHGPKQTEYVAIDMYPPNDPEIVELLQEAERTFRERDFYHLTQKELLLLTQSLLYCEYRLGKGIIGTLSSIAENAQPENKHYFLYTSLYAHADIDILVLEGAEVMYNRRFDESLQHEIIASIYSRMLILHGRLDEARSIAVRFLEQESRDGTLSGSSSLLARSLAKVYLLEEEYENALSFTTEYMNKNPFFFSNTPSIQALIEVQQSARTALASLDLPWHPQEAEK